MAIAAGSPALAADIANLTRREYTANASSVAHTVTTTVADLPGATLTIVTPVANTVVGIEAKFDVESTGGVDIFLGTCSVAGTSQAGEAHHQGAARSTPSQHWTVTLGAAGSYVIKLRVQKFNNSNTVTCYGSSHSKVTVTGNGISV